MVTPGGIALSDSEKVEALADSLETQFQAVTDPSVPAVTEMVDVALRRLPQAGSKSNRNADSLTSKTHPPPRVLIWLPNW
jgi:hypothetical protein